MKTTQKPQNRYKITIGGVDYTHCIPLPIKWGAMLDERLDEGSLSIRHTKTALIPPMTDVKISMTDKLGNTSEMTFIVSADSAEETPVGSGWYNHELLFIEETKKLERVIVDALTFTNDLGRMYTDGETTAEPIYE